MKRNRAAFYYRLSVLMATLAFGMFIVLVVALVYLVIETLPPNANEVCVVGDLGICWLRDEYQVFYFIILFSVGLMAVFLILASQFQQYFIPERLAKLERRRDDKAKRKALNLKERMKKNTLEVFEVKKEDQTQSKVKKPKEAAIVEEDSDDITESSLKEIVDVQSQPSSDIKHEPENEPTLKRENLSYDERLEVGNQAEEDTLQKTPSDPPKKTAKSPPTKRKPSSKTPAIVIKNVLTEKTKKRRTQAHTKEDLSLVIESLTDLNAQDSRVFLDTFTTVISDALIAHEKIAIHQFGTFFTKELKARTMQVPSLEEAATNVAAHHVIRFKPSPHFIRFLNSEEPPDS